MRLNPETRLFENFTPAEAHEMTSWAERILNGAPDVFKEEVAGLGWALEPELLDNDWCRLWSAMVGFGSVVRLEVLAGPRPQRSFVGRVLLSVIRNWPTQSAVAENRFLLEENQRLSRWVEDLQSGMFVNCIYCGHRYGPSNDTPVAIADVLKQHAEQCTQHPLAAATARIARLEKLLTNFVGDVRAMVSEPTP
jgi:hypothetical protein